MQDLRSRSPQGVFICPLLSRLTGSCCLVLMEEEKMIYRDSRAPLQIEKLFYIPELDVNTSVSDLKFPLVHLLKFPRFGHGVAW